MINLDSDGLLFDWRGYVLANHFPEMTIEVLNGLDSSARHILLEDMYRKDPQLFYKLKPIDGAAEFIEFVDGTCERWQVLTSIGDDHYDPELAKNCKVLSLQIAFGIPEDRITVTLRSEDKSKYCTPGSILVDDYIKNIEAWERAGGFGILVGENINWEATKDAIHVALNPPCA